MPTKWLFVYYTRKTDAIQTYLHLCVRKITHSRQTSSHLSLARPFRKATAPLSRLTIPSCKTILRHTSMQNQWKRFLRFLHNSTSLSLYWPTSLPNVCGLLLVAAKYRLRHLLKHLVMTHNCTLPVVEHPNKAHQRQLYIPHTSLTTEFTTRVAIHGLMPRHACLTHPCLSFSSLWPALTENSLQIRYHSHHQITPTV